jgi:type VI secretion system protein ImpG
MSGRDDLKEYYLSELGFIRGMVDEFARKHSGIADRLLIEPGAGGPYKDPHVERLIESFAMLTARVRMRLDDDYPELTDGLLGMLYPHYLAPIPSATVVQFALDPDQSGAERGVQVPRHTMLNATQLVHGVRCRFRTAYPVSLWPIEVSAVDVVPVRENERGMPAGAQAAIRISLRAVGGRPLSESKIPSLTFFLDGDTAISHRVYEELFRNPLGVILRRPPASPGEPAVEVFIKASHVRPLGFEENEGLLEYPSTAHLGYRLLQEYFAFPIKFMFFEVSGLKDAPEAGQTLEIIIPLDRPPRDLAGKLRPEHFKLGCTPAVNLFPMQADPQPMDGTTTEIPVVPDRRSPRGFEVYAIQEVGSTVAGGRRRTFRPFYALHHNERDPAATPYWHAERRPSTTKDDDGTDVSLTLVDRSRQNMPVAGEVLHVSCLCTNRDVAAGLSSIGDARGDFRVEGKAAIGRVAALRIPSRTIRSPHRREGQWRLVSHLSLNYLSLSSDKSTAYGTAVNGQGAEGASTSLRALREILSLYDFADTQANRDQIAGLTGVTTRRALRALPGPWGTSHVSGLEVTIELKRTANASALLFASVLERFFALYVSVNSFTETVAKASGEEQPLKRWPPRTGDTPLL